jgi:formate/nitrite transporter FocA (FNT family)
MRDDEINGIVLMVQDLHIILPGGGAMAEDQRKKDSEHREAEQRSAPSGQVVYKAILQEGEGELARPSSALFWSGLAAGLSMGFSMIAEGLLGAYLPEADWKPLVAKLGYSVGFLIVVLGRQQLFTENTLTPILPLLQQKDGKTLANVLRLWSVVLLANLIGAAAIALVAARTNAFDPQVQRAFLEIGQKAMEHGFRTLILRGILAGWLIALMVWLLPFAESARVWVIVIITYVVGLGSFSHVIVGAIETFTLAAMGQTSWLTALGGYVLPTLIGNILGGVMLVATLNHAQVVAGRGGEDI